MGKSCCHGRSGGSGRVVPVFSAAAAPGTAPRAGFTIRSMSVVGQVGDGFQDGALLGFTEWAAALGTGSLL